MGLLRVSDMPIAAWQLCMPSRARYSAHAFRSRVTGGLHTAAVIRARHTKQDQHHRINDLVLICCVLHNTPRRVSMCPQLAYKSGAIAKSAEASKGPHPYQLPQSSSQNILHWIAISMPDGQGLCSVSGLQPRY